MSEIAPNDREGSPTADGGLSNESEIDLAGPYLQVVRDFSAQQREVLRLAEYVSEREHEIDDRKADAVSRVQRLYPGATPEMIEPLWEKLSGLLTRMAESDLNESEREEHKQELYDIISETPEGYGEDLFSEIFNARVESPRSPRLLASLLTALIGDFEVMIAGLVRQLIWLQPNILATDNTKYGWKEVAAFASFENFKEDVIEKAVDGVLRGSFSDWMDFFSGRCYVQVPALAESYVVQEIFQRRHVIVHNGAKVSRSYVQKLEGYKTPKGSVPRAIGTELIVDLEYLKAAADALSVLAVTLTGVCAKKFLKSSADQIRVEAMMGDYPYQLIQDGRFQCSYDISREQDLDNYSDNYKALLVTVNRWLALKRLGKLSECRDEIEMWQTRALPRVFRLAQLALLDEHKEAYEVALELRGTRPLAGRFWLSWPLLEELRAYEASLPK